jgi:hypothetical protein
VNAWLNTRKGHLESRRTVILNFPASAVFGVCDEARWQPEGGCLQHLPSLFQIREVLKIRKDLKMDGLTMRDIPQLSEIRNRDRKKRIEHDADQARLIIATLPEPEADMTDEPEQPFGPDDDWKPGKAAEILKDEL